MKLFGKCHWAGQCLCGLCASYPINQVHVVIIRTSNGVSYTVKVSQLEIAQQEQERYVFGNNRRRKK